MGGVLGQIGMYGVLSLDNKRRIWVIPTSKIWTLQVSRGQNMVLIRGLRFSKFSYAPKPFHHAYAFYASVAAPAVGETNTCRDTF